MNTIPFYKHLVFLQPLLPSVLSEEDAGQLVEAALRRMRQPGSTSARVMCGCMVVPGQLLSGLNTALSPLVTTKAQEVRVVMGKSLRLF